MIDLPPRYAVPSSREAEIVPMHLVRIAYPENAVAKDDKEDTDQHCDDAKDDRNKSLVLGTKTYKRVTTVSIGCISRMHN